MTPALPQLVPLSLPQYALKARETNRFEASPNEFDNLRFGYFGETGGLLASVKKSGRDQLTEPQSALAAEELGDALWYLVSTARLLGISPDDLGEQCIRSLRKRFNDSEREPSLPSSGHRLRSRTSPSPTGFARRKPRSWNGWTCHPRSPRCGNSAG